jgi:5'-3' exonuclease
MGVPVLTISGVEADDIIGTIARRSVEAGLHVTIVSPDKDFFQLLGPRVRQLRPNGKNYDAATAARAEVRPPIRRSPYDRVRVVHVDP